MFIDAAINHLKAHILFFEIYKEIGCESYKIAAKKIATQMKVELTFHEKRIIHIKKYFNENVNDGIIN